MAYVVYLIGSDDLRPFRHFETHQAAAEYARACVQSARAEQADIYEVPDATGPRDAIAAVRIGAARLLESRDHRANERAAPGKAQTSGRKAILKYLGFN